MSPQPPLVIYHANCADGFAAAWVFHHLYQRQGDSRPGPDFHPGHYGEPPPDVAGRNVYLVDFSYKRDVVEQMLRTAEHVCLIDHHKTAIDDLAGIESDRFSRFTDLNRSGATLAWDFLFPHQARPLLLGHIEDRDLWRFKLPHTEELSAAVFSLPYSFETWDKLMAADMHDLLNLTVQGAAIVRKQRKDVAELLATTQRTLCIAGQVVQVANLPYTMASDAGHVMALADPTRFAAVYWDTPTLRQFSLRSLDPTGMDVGQVAAMYGGGGHVHAAGFRVGRDHALAVA